MQDAQIIGAVVAIFGIVDLAVMVFIVIPRLKMPAKTKKILLTATSAVSVAMVIIGALIFFLAGGDS